MTVREDAAAQGRGRQPLTDDQAHSAGQTELQRVDLWLEAMLLMLAESAEEGCGCAWRGLEQAYMGSAFAADWIAAPRTEDPPIPKQFAIDEAAAVGRTLSHMMALLNTLDAKAMRRAASAVVRQLGMSGR